MLLSNADVIDTLAAILERRDEAEALFYEQGGEVLIDSQGQK